MTDTFMSITNVPSLLEMLGNILCLFIYIFQQIQGEYKQDVVGQVNPPKFDMCEDMSNLTYLNEGSVLYNLAARYIERLIYVSI